MSAPDKIWIEPAWAETFARPDGDPVKIAYIPEAIAQTAVAAALEAAAQWHDAEIDRLEAQIAENNKYLQLAGKSTKSTANDFCDAGIGYHRGSAAHLRALITPSQHDALAAHVAAEVAKARAEDAATVLRYRPTGENAKHFVDVLVCDIANEILTGEKAK